MPLLALVCACACLRLLALTKHISPCSPTVPAYNLCCQFPFSSFQNALSVPPLGQDSTPLAHAAHLRGMRIAGCGGVDFQICGFSSFRIKKIILPEASEASRGFRRHSGSFRRLWAPGSRGSRLQPWLEPGRSQKHGFQTILDTILETIFQTFWGQVLGLDA